MRITSRIHSYPPGSSTATSPRAFAFTAEASKIVIGGGYLASTAISLSTIARPDKRRCYPGPSGAHPP